MASGVLGKAMPFVPANLLLFELIAASSVVGLTSPASPVRPLTLPVLAASIYGIVKTAAQHMRPRWASLLGGMAASLFLRYLDVALITRWDFEGQAPSANVSPTTDVEAKAKQPSSPEPESIVTGKNASIWQRFAWGWNTMWSFRQINTPYEVRNSPPFSTSDPKYVPPRWQFVAQKAALASVCYLVLDLLAQRPPPNNAGALFSPALIPFFRRLGEVSWPQIKLRAISIVMFFVTFYCVIQGVYSFAAAVTVVTGLSNVSSWRPPFGKFSDAYSVRNFWGKVWHQNLRRLVSAPASYLVYDVFGFKRGNAVADSTYTVASFAVSGILHLLASHSSGMPLKEMGVVQFFCTQGCGIVFETTILRLIRGQQSGKARSGTTGPSMLERGLGYCWVLAFLTWSGPMWLYPQMARQSPQPGATSFVPYSVVQAWQAR